MSDNMPDKNELAANAEAFLQRVREELVKMEIEAAHLQGKINAWRDAAAFLTGEVRRQRRTRASWPAPSSPVLVPDNDDPPAAA